MKKVALIRGDGTGPELVDAMLKVVEVSGARANIELIICDAGYEWWQRHDGDSYIPPGTWETLKQSDACFKGPTTTVPLPDAPKSVAVSIRQAFELYANIRPIKTLPNTGTRAEVDFICVREATEGLYSGLDFMVSDDTAISIRKITRKGCERVVKYAFNLAKEKGWTRLVTVSKANILRNTDFLFLDTVRRIGKDYPGVEIWDYFIDNLAQQLVKNPERFNQSIILGTNLFMDIISEEAAGLIGSIGCVYSANIGDNYAMFEPAHGSAPKYKGQDKVNPTATILSAAWMLDYLGEKEASKAIFKATMDVYREGKYLTYDVGGTAKTSEMAAAIAEKVTKIMGK